MSIWNKVLVGLIIVASLGFFYLAVRTLRTHEHWEETARDHLEGTGQGAAYRPGIKWHQAEIAELEGQVREVTSQLRKLLAERGRVWANCRPGADANTEQTGLVAVATSGQAIGEGTVLYVFDESDVQHRGRYVGEFKVVTLEVLDQNASGTLEGAELPGEFRPYFATADRDGSGTLDPAEFSAAKANYPGPELLRPTMAMTDEELRGLAAGIDGGTTWRIYESMPGDSHAVFAHLDEEQLSGLFPAEAIKEYLKDGQMLTVGELQALGLQGTLVAVDESGRVKYENQDGKTLYSSGVDDQGRLVYEDQDGSFVCAAAVQRQVDADGEVSYSIQYLNQQGRVLPGVRVSEKQVDSGEGRYLRPLRDYDVLLRESRRQRSELFDQLENARVDLGYVQDALAEAKKHLKFREDEQSQLTAELQRYQSEAGVVYEVLEDLRRKLKDCRDAVDQLISENRAAAAEIDRFQQDIERQIEARTGEIAQSGSGGAG